MVRKAGQFDFWYSEKELEILVEKYGITDKKELKKLIKKDSLKNISENEIEDPKLSIDEKLKKVKLANETLKAWNTIRSSGGTVDDLEKLVNHQEIPNFENNHDNTNAITIADEKPKLELKTFGKTIINKPKQILQKDGTLRCMRCNRKIEMRAFDFEQLDDYRNHVENNHGKLYESERKELMEMYAI
jgi:hypothetical protein